MESTPAKRRKISHPSSPGLDGRSVSSPPKPAPRDGSRTTPRRASFRSPTKASIARFNPELVARPQSASSADRRIKTRRDGGITSPRRRLLSPPVSSINGGSQMEATAAATSLRRSTRSSIARSSLAPTEDSHGQSRQEMTPAPSVEEAGQASRATTAQRLLQTPPRRRSRLNDRFEVVWSDPRGKQNPGDDATTGGTVHTRSTIAGRGPMRTPVGLRQRKQSLNNADKDDEPDLPSTPSRSGNHSIGGTRVPGGLLNSPSLRSKKDKTSRGPSSLGRETTSVHPNESDSNLHPIEDEDLDLPDAEDHTETPPQAGQEETREQLLAELRELQEEVQHLENQVAAATSTRHQTIPKNKPRLEPIPFSFNAFLPFSRRRLNNKSTAPSSLPIPDHPPPSHHPIEVDDPLPYLQSFTPLTFSSTYESIPSAAGNASGRYQLHHIKVTSPGDLLTSRIRLTVDTTTHSIAALTIPGLSSWAESELGTWIRARAKDNSPAGKDITSICWAMGRYWVLAKRRAHYWMRCEREFKSLIISTSSHRSQRRRSGHQNGAEQGEDHDSIDEDEDDDDDDEEEIDEDRARTAKRQDLLRHLGRSSITFRQGRVQLLMGWHIGFDWTGEAHSEVSATASVPGSWNQIDTRSSLSKISPLFQTLMTDKGVLGATRVVTRLLFSDDE